MKTSDAVVFHPHPPNKAFRDITGNVYDRLTILGYAGPKLMPSGGYAHKWWARCVCGNVITTFKNGLGKTTRSCGCFHREQITTHGVSHSTMHRTWSSMISRCSNPLTKEFRNYGGRGITVSEEWKGVGGFERFAAHMGPKPTTKHTLDRINTNGNYEPGNVRWATMKEQQNNRRNNRILECDGVRKTLTQWAKDYGINCRTLANRLERGWTTRMAIETPVDH